MKNIYPDDLPNFIIIYDSEWKINKINASAISTLGYAKASELIGRTIKDIMPENEHTVLNAFCLDVEEKNKSIFLSKEIRFLRKDGKHVNIFSQFGLISHKQSLGENKYIQSGFYCRESTLENQEFNNIHFLKILSDNIPGIMMLVIDKNHEIHCSLGSEKAKAEEDNEQPKKGKELLPESILDIIKPLLHIVFEGTSVSREFNHGNDNWSIRIIPISEQNKSDLAVIILQNITETKIIENKLRASKEVAEKANEAKSDFIAKMSHEIRTPLNAIIGFTEQLIKTKLTKKQSTYLEVVNNSSHHLLSTINDILILSKVESEKVTVYEEVFSLEKIVNAVKGIFELSAKKKNLDFQISCNPPIKDLLLGDSAKIRQVLINLLGNAIKFTHQGGISLSYSVVNRSSKNLTIRFDVTDSGIGIRDDQLKHIFEPFKQLDNSPSRSYFGSGLGLTISQSQVKSMGGEIRVKSIPGKGSTFSFTLTFKKSKKQLPEYNDDKLLQPNTLLENQRILFVDDDLVSRMLGKIILSQYNTKSVFVSSGEEAINKFKLGKFSIILLDINMPDVSGIDVAKHIRKIEKSNKNLPRAKIIAITANVSKKHIKEYLKIGMDDYISKPFSESNLIKKIAVNSIEKKAEYSKLKQDAKLAGQDIDFNLDELLCFTKGDEYYTLLMLDTFIENGKRMLFQMQQSFNEDDYPSIAEAAHRLLPSVEQLGFNKATTLLKDIETRYLKKKKFFKDPVLIKQVLNELESCIEKISIAKENFY